VYVLPGACELPARTRLTPRPSVDVATALDEKPGGEEHDGPHHQHEDRGAELDVALGPAGHAGGRLKGGLHIKAADGTPMANPMLTMLHAIGCDDVDKLGDSTGELDLNNAAAEVTTDAAKG